ncbi:MAG: hypothetical protein K0R40_2893, partial [Burkholderiales bacterium]|nr:hypothetical protein [Burkholderiales bacterium]
LARGAQPELLNTTASTIVLAQTVDRTRGKDKAEEGPVQGAAHGVSNSFDSAEATQRLASLTGAASGPVTATQALGAIPRPPRSGWRRRDWLLVGGAALAGVLIAGAIVRRK